MTDRSAPPDDGKRELEEYLSNEGNYDPAPRKPEALDAQGSEPSMDRVLDDGTEIRWWHFGVDALKKLRVLPHIKENGDIRCTGCYHGDMRLRVYEPKLHRKPEAQTEIVLHRDVADTPSGLSRWSECMGAPCGAGEHAVATIRRAE